ncbi:PepSY-associated TM helix domain-containing protein [Candidatus Laterigemmans baculatus]|uniref:PepSY-associated TM helix domain-containing protein n=1 Tax=Candidatus Laterigemmans baculatus TaxID=2770505 RepID=UPI0013DAFA5B|nr:PepSY domain-containing protein [Candidatus Laterigemmans baculatus]
MSIDVVEAPVAEAAPHRPQRPARQPASSLFRVIWRWHFYAGLIVSPLIIVAALTGGIYLFGAEIVDLANRQLLFVESVGQPVPYQRLIDAAEAAVPGGTATRIVVHTEPSRAAAVTVSPPAEESPAADGASSRSDRGRTVYVDPYTAEVQGTLDGPLPLESFFRIVRQIHQRLFAGTTGRILVELATTWTLILILSGVYLWWPRRKEKTKGVWLPRWPAKPYTVLRDVHALAGVYLVPVCLVIILSGLYYSLVWGESFHFVSKQFFATAAVEDVEQSGDDAEDATPYVAPAFTLQQAITKARSVHPVRDVTVTLPSQSADHYEVSAINDYARGTYGAMNSSSYKIHRETGEVLELSHLSESERWWGHAWAYPLHVGSIVGPLSKIVWLLASLVLVVLPFTGLWMWWKRRPQGGTGFPRKPSFEVVPAWIWISIVLLCLLLPMFGISVLAILVADRLVRSLRPTPA